MSALPVALVGCGYWGSKLLRVLREADECRLVLVADPQAAARSRVQRQYPDLAVTASFDDVVRDRGIAAAVLATPVATHFDFARRLLLAGKHVLVEKPLATRVEDAAALVELAQRQRRTLMVDHVFLYTGAVRWMKQAIEAGKLGRLLYFDSVRINLGLIQRDTNVLWDLGPHDFAIMDHLCAESPVGISAHGLGHFEAGREDVCYVTAHFASNFIAHFHLNWLAPVKVRRTLLGGTQRMLVYDDTEASEKVRLYDRGVTVTRGAEERSGLLADYRDGDVIAPLLERQEALARVVQEFVSAIASGRPALSDGVAGLRVVRMLAAAQASLERGGATVELESGAGGDALPRTLARALSRAGAA